VAVGELDRWSRAVAASSVAAADSAVARYPLLGPALLHDTSQSVTKPSSGGSAGGGSAAGRAAVPVAAEVGPGDVDCGFARDID
jgi:hypothetical protein